MRTGRTRSGSPSRCSAAANIRAARIGPTVCELDGPMPILKRSKTLIAMSWIDPSRNRKAVPMLRVGASLNFPFHDIMCNVSVRVRALRVGAAWRLAGDNRVVGETEDHVAFRREPIAPVTRKRMMDVEHRGRPPATSAITSGRPSPKLRVGFVLTPRFTLTAFAGFIDALRLAADEGDRSRQIGCEWAILGTPGAPIAASCGAVVLPQERIES